MLNRGTGGGGQGWSLCTREGNQRFFRNGRWSAFHGNEEHAYKVWAWASSEPRSVCIHAKPPSGGDGLRGHPGSKELENMDYNGTCWCWYHRGSKSLSRIQILQVRDQELIGPASQGHGREKGAVSGGGSSRWMLRIPAQEFRDSAMQKKKIRTNHWCMEGIEIRSSGKLVAMVRGEAQAELAYGESQIHTRSLRATLTSNTMFSQDMS